MLAFFALLGATAAYHVPVLVAIIGGAITVAAGLGGIAGFHAYKSAAAGWREERDAAVAKAARLEAKVERLEATVATQGEQIKALQSKDVSSLYDLMALHHREFESSWKSLQERDAELAKAIRAIATAVIPPIQIRED